MNHTGTSKVWDTRKRGRQRRLERAANLGLAPQITPEQITQLLQTVIEPGDRVYLEGNNQKQADFLADSLAACDPQQLHHLHMVQSVLALPSHLDLFENGIASRLDFSFSGPPGARLARLVQDKQIEIRSQE